MQTDLESSWFGDHMLMPPGKFFTMFHFLVRTPLLLFSSRTSPNAAGI